MKLITENIEDVEFITEDRGDGGKNYYFHGPFLEGNIKNKNGRKYPIDTLCCEVDRYNRDMVHAKRSWGELGHPQGPTINLDRVSHIITELKRDGDCFIGKAMLTETPMGNIARGLMKAGTLGVSTRGMGSLQPGDDGVMIVQPDFKLATAADIVADPSAPHAFVSGIMENVEWLYDPVKNTWFEQRLDEIKKEVHKMSRSQLEERQLSLFEDYLLSLASK